MRLRATNANIYIAGHRGMVGRAARQHGFDPISLMPTRTYTARIKLGLQEETYLGNLDAKRDWGNARDCVEGKAADASARRTQRSCARDGTDDADTGRCVVEIDPRYYRPTEVNILLGDAVKARKQPGWQPSTSLEAMARRI